jgi:hypothetical protein
MTLSEEKRNLILQDFIDAFQAKYGEQWRFKLTSNLRPSPIQHIVEQRDVKVSDVRKIRSQLMAIGRMILILQTISEPLPNYDPMQPPEWLIQ